MQWLLQALELQPVSLTPPWDQTQPQHVEVHVVRCSKAQGACAEASCGMVKVFEGQNEPQQRKHGIGNLLTTLRLHDCNDRAQRAPHNIIQSRECDAYICQTRAIRREFSWRSRDVQHRCMGKPPASQRLRCITLTKQSLAYCTVLRAIWRSSLIFCLLCDTTLAAISGLCGSEAPVECRCDGQQVRWCAQRQPS